MTQFDDALSHLRAARDALELEAWRGESLARMERVDHFTIAEELKRVDGAVGPRGESMFARLADCIEEAYTEILAATEALFGGNSGGPLREGEDTTPTADDAVRVGIAQAIAFVRKRCDDYVAEHGMYDPSTGVMEFPGNGDDTVGEWEEIIEGLEALASAATGAENAQVEPAAAGKVYGPYGWLNGHRGLNEESGGLESVPLENSDEYFSIPPYALSDPFKEIGKTSPDVQAATDWPRGTRIRVEHDGFAGVVLDPYTTLEGKRGQVCQLAGARVVHVYGEKWLQRVDGAEAARHG